MPRWYIPDFEAVFSVQKASEVIVLSLSVAVVIMAETLLAENNFAQKNGYRIDDNTELFGIFHRKYGCGFYGLLSDKRFSVTNCDERAVRG